MSGRALLSDEITMDSQDELAEWLHATGRTDGLPVVLPTLSRVGDMLDVAAFAGLDHDIVLGQVGPNMGEATVEKVAINAVMSGCRPEYLPVVIAAIKALCDVRLDTTEMQSTTHDLAPLLIVNGPIAGELGIAGGFGALGTGHRANLAIGRAVRLCLTNLGGGRPGLSDMALLGHPGKIAYCLAENTEDSPLPALHTSLGFSADQSVVTVTGVGAPRSVLAFTNADDEQEPDRVLEILARTISSIGNNNALLGRGTVVVCLNPDHAALLTRAGHTRQSIQEELWRRSANPRSLVEWAKAGALAPRVAAEEIAYATDSPQSILVIVAGGAGLYSAVMTPWAAGPHHGARVSVEIVTTDACDVPIRACD